MIRTKRLYIRKLKPEDYLEYFKITKIDDYSLLQYACFFCSDSPEHAMERIKSYSTNHSQIYGIWNFSDNILIGAFLFEHTFCCNFISISYFIGKNYRGNGYCLEALHGIIENTDIICSDFDYDITEIRFSVSICNKSSIRVQEKLSSVLYNRTSEYLRYSKKIQD